MVDRDPRHGVMRRVAGYHDLRLDGISDLLLRARGMSVLDIGCNRGMVGVEFASNGASVVSGVDNYEDGIKVAREIFADIRSVTAQFEVVDLTKGPRVLNCLAQARYDTVLLLAIVHKLKRAMGVDPLRVLLADVGRRAQKYVAWRGTEHDVNGNEWERKLLDEVLGAAGLRCVQWSSISALGPAGIWARV